MILASGARGRGFDSPLAPSSFLFSRKLFFNKTILKKKGIIIANNQSKHQRVHSSVVEHGIADPAVTGSNPVVPSLFSWLV